MSKHKIFTINPGSTSTKVALFEDNKKIFSKSVSHDAKQLEQFDTISEQFSYRKSTILNMLSKEKLSLNGITAAVGRGGGLLAMEGGTYKIDELVLKHAGEGANGVQHPAILGPGLAYDFAKDYGVPAFVVNPPDVDELQDLARVTGIKGVYRVVHLHALNLKETAIQHAASEGKKYEDCNFIVCHIGGGISVSAHRKGKMIDGFDIVGGEGPMAPTRCGGISVSDLLNYAKEKEIKEVRQLCTKNGGFVSHLNTSDTLEVIGRAENGDQYALLLWNSMIYQIQKSIGAMAAVLHGNIDGILLGGSMARNKDLVGQIKNVCEWIAPISVYPGEFEMEAMAAGAIRALNGQEEVKNYTGKCIFQGFSFEKE